MTIKLRQLKIVQLQSKYKRTLVLQLQCLIKIGGLFYKKATAIMNIFLETNQIEYKYEKEDLNNEYAATYNSGHFRA